MSLVEDRALGVSTLIPPSPPGTPKIPARPSIPFAAIWIAVSAAVLAGFAAVCGATGIAFSDLSRDASEILDFPVYIGALSHLGILVWGAGSAVCLFAAWLQVSGDDAGERRRFLAVSAAVTAWLVLDDLLTLHEVVIPSLLGMRQRYVLALYAAGMVVYLVRFRKTILRTEYSILLLSLSCFGVSVLADILQTRLSWAGHHYLEDGAKLAGIASWTAYFARTAMLQVRSGARETAFAAI